VFSIYEILLKSTVILFHTSIIAVRRRKFELELVMIKLTVPLAAKLLPENNNGIFIKQIKIEDSDVTKFVDNFAQLPNLWAG
jgi:hypothetical protein